MPSALRPMSHEQVRRGPGRGQTQDTQQPLPVLTLLLQATGTWPDGGRPSEIPMRRGHRQSRHRKMTSNSGAKTSMLSGEFGGRRGFRTPDILRVRHGATAKPLYLQGIHTTKNGKKHVFFATRGHTRGARVRLNDSQDLMREYKRKWVARRKAAIMAAMGPCIRCRSNEELRLHHVDPETKVSHVIWSWRPSRIEAELAKCVILCEPCHKLIHKKMHKPSVWSHGTNTGYRHGCKCEPCTVAKRLSKRPKTKRARAAHAEARAWLHQWSEANRGGGC